MPHPIVEKILKDGIASINVAMLSPDLRKRLMNEAATTLLANNRYSESAEALRIGDDKEQLREIGHWLLAQHRYGAAALFLRHVETPDVLQRLAHDCISAGDIASAKSIYTAIDDKTMVAFLDANFPQ